MVGKVLESQFTGSRALQRYSHFMFGFERNKQAVVEHVSKFRVLKNRPYGRTGMFKTAYNTATGTATRTGLARREFRGQRLMHCYKEDKRVRDKAIRERRKMKQKSREFGE